MAAASLRQHNNQRLPGNDWNIEESLRRERQRESIECRQFKMERPALICRACCKQYLAARHDQHRRPYDTPILRIDDKPERQLVWNRCSGGWAGMARVRNSSSSIRSAGCGSTSMPISENDRRDDRSRYRQNYCRTHHNTSRH